MILNIDRSGGMPLFRQIIDAIRSYIDDGSLVAGTALPSTRELAERLAVNRTTVTQAYGELQALGYLSSHPGSYHIVEKRRREVPYNPVKESIIDWEGAVNSELVRLGRNASSLSPERAGSGPQDIISMARLSPDSRLFPVPSFRASLARVLERFSASSLQYGHYRGYEPLRDYIARRLRLHGISVSEREILVTKGAQQALDLVAVESLLSRHQVAFVYTIPNFQNPTGITTSHPHRERLLALCAHHRVPLVEEGFEEEMKYFGRVPLPFKSIDEQGLVIYLGTFSKTLFPGLRVGWITAHRRFIDQVTMQKRCTDLSSGNLTQIALHHFCSEGYYDRHLKKLHRVYRRRMERALAGLEEHLPPGVEWPRPRGGYLVWLKVPAAFTDEGLHERLLPHGVAVCHGSHFFSAGGASPYFRLSISALNEVEIREGIARLGKALRELEHNGWRKEA